MGVDWNKPLQTRCGAKPARFLGALKCSPGTRSHLIAYEGDNGEEYTYRVYPSGLADGPFESGDDIINAPEVTEQYAAIYPLDDEHYGGGGISSGTYAYWWKSPDGVAINGGLGAVKVTLKDGKPVSAEIVQ